MHGTIIQYLFVCFLFIPACTRNSSKKLITSITASLRGVASKWFEIATLLGVPVNKLNSIKEECDGSTEACLNAVIEVWVFMAKLSSGWVVELVAF